MHACGSLCRCTARLCLPTLLVRVHMYTHLGWLACVRLSVPICSSLDFIRSIPSSSSVSVSHSRAIYSSRRPTWTNTCNAGAFTLHALQECLNQQTCTLLQASLGAPNVKACTAFLRIAKVKFLREAAKRGAERSDATGQTCCDGLLYSIV